MSDLCLPLGLNKGDVNKLENIVSSSKVLQPGEQVLDQGRRFDKIYAVKSGMCKSSRVDESGTEYVQGFHLSGEIFGLDAIYPGRYSFSVETLDTTVLCELDYHQLQDLCVSVPSLQRQMFNLLSRDIYNSLVNPIEHFDQTAEQKLAGFLHNLSARLMARGYAPNELYLPMSRRDIANHLEVTPETISRLLKKFQQKGVIEVENRSVRIMDSTQLESLVHCHALETTKNQVEITQIA